MSLTQVFQFMHEESWASVTWSWTFAGWRVLNLGCTSDWTQHSSISGSKMACVNYAAFVIVIKNNLCVIFYTIFWFRQEWFDVWNIFFTFWKSEMKKKKYKPATEQCQHPFCLCVGMRDTSSLYIFFVLLSVWSFDLFLAVIPSHRYIDFVALTADFMIFVTWIWNLVVFDWLFFLGPSCDFCHCDCGLPLEQPSSRLLICDAASSFESSVRTTRHALAIPDTNVKLHHSTMGHLCVLHWQV